MVIINVITNIYAIFAGDQISDLNFWVIRCYNWYRQNIYIAIFQIIMKDIY